MSFVSPPESKRAVNTAGSKIAEQIETQDDVRLVDQWRSSHAYVLNTFQIFFKRRIGASNLPVEFAQRLKRRNTIIDKLRRRKPDGSKLMGDVTSMQDFAGCRLIFESIADLDKFRIFLHSSPQMKNVKHFLKHKKSPDKFNYISHPKWTGYRGIHEVFVHQPRPHRKGQDTAAPWRGLLVEVQYRTRIQHAWATALEISDFVDGERTKFALEPHQVNERSRFFALVSELLARFHEDVTNAVLDKDIDSIRQEIREIEGRIGVLARLRAMRAVTDAPELGRHNVLNLRRMPNGEVELDVRVFKNHSDAIEKSKEYERSPDSVNAVYVSSSEPKELRRAYLNYFNDPVDFVQLVEQALN
jgi:ppGpp synthetase/RelA/SpoT-type nucleotidyltranferase